jgi:predicted alpha/beta-hydrolase family hydrolase
MYSIKQLDIPGYGHEPVPHTFFQQQGAAQHVAILLPGMGYTSHMPLLYYPARIMLGLGADVLSVEYEYNRREDFLALKGDERRRWLLTDVANSCHSVLNRRSYKEITIIGKSIGTRAMGQLLTTEDQLKHATAIWLTPLLRSENLRAQIQQVGQRSLFVIGTADPQYDQTHLEEVRKATKGEILVIEGADHSLEIEGSVAQSLQAMETIIRTIQSFVAS